MAVTGFQRHAAGRTAGPLAHSRAGDQWGQRQPLARPGGAVGAGGAIALGNHYVALANASAPGVSGAGLASTIVGVAMELAGRTASVVWPGQGGDRLPIGGAMARYVAHAGGGRTLQRG